MHVLGHNHVADYVESVADAALFQPEFEPMHRGRTRQQRLAAVATEGDEVKVATFLIALQSSRHKNRIAAGRRLSVMGDTGQRDCPALAKRTLERAPRLYGFVCLDYAWPGHPAKGKLFSLDIPFYRTRQTVPSDPSYLRR